MGGVGVSGSDYFILCGWQCGEGYHDPYPCLPFASGSFTVSAGASVYSG